MDSWRNQCESGYDCGGTARAVNGTSLLTQGTVPLTTRSQVCAESMRITTTEIMKTATTAASRRSLNTMRAASPAVFAPGRQRRPRASVAAIEFACERNPSLTSGEKIFCQPPVSVDDRRATRAGGS